ncbi:hypothetical protein MP228_009827 [Amoeboaphelidium protococcarum]|nr:hypothetical protein MP228_009827 [Amoeboaphelidium protococcarum]
MAITGNVTGTTSVELLPGQYVVDIHYSVCLAIELFCLGILLFNTKRWNNLLTRIKKPLFAGWLFFEVIISIIIFLGLVINERPSNPAVNAAKIEIVHTIMSLHIVAKVIACVLVSVRSYILVLDKKPRMMLVAFNVTLSIAVFGVLVGLIIEHLDMQKFAPVRTVPQKQAKSKIVASLNLAQLALYATFIITNSMFIVYYVGRKLIEREGYWSYLKKAPSAKLGVIVVTDLVLQFIVTCVVFSGAIPMTRAYFHGTVLSFVLFSCFYYFNTFEDIGNAITENNRVMTNKSTVSLQKKVNGSRDELGQNGVKSFKTDYVKGVNKSADLLHQKSSVLDSEEIISEEQQKRSVRDSQIRDEPEVK